MPPCLSQANTPTQECLECWNTLTLSLHRRSAPLGWVPWTLPCMDKPRSCCLIPFPVTQVYKSPVLYAMGGHFPQTVTQPCGSAPKLSPTRETPSVSPLIKKKNLFPELKASLLLWITFESNSSFWFHDVCRKGKEIAEQLSWLCRWLSNALDNKCLQNIKYKREIHTFLGM